MTNYLKLLIFFPFIILSQALFAQTNQGNVDIIQKIEEEITRLKLITQDELASVPLDTPDLDVAQKVLSLSIQDALKKFYQDLASNREVIIEKLSKIESLRKYATSREPKGGGVYTYEYLEELKIGIPKLNSIINNNYEQAFSKLVSLNSKETILFDPGWGIKKTWQIRNSSEMLASKKISEICQTRVCKRVITQKIIEWNEFVRQFNQEITILNPFSETVIWSYQKSNFSPQLSLDLLSASKEILKIELKKNKEYSITQIGLKGIQDLAEIPLGIMMAITAAPAYVLEQSVAALSADISRMKLELKIEKVRMHSHKKIARAFEKRLEHINNLPPVIYVDEGPALLTYYYFEKLNFNYQDKERMKKYFDSILCDNNTKPGVCLEFSNNHQKFFFESLVHGVHVMSYPYDLKKLVESFTEEEIASLTKRNIVDDNFLKVVSE